MSRTMVDGPMAAGRLWVLSVWRWVIVELLHGCIERWSVGRWSLIDARLLGDVRFLNLRRKPALVWFRQVRVSPQI